MVYYFQLIFVGKNQYLRKDVNDGPMKKKIILLLQKLGTEENTKYANLTQPKKQEQFCCKFSIRDNLFHTQYTCLNIIKQEDDDFVTYADVVNAQCEVFKLKELSIDMF